MILCRIFVSLFSSPKNLNCLFEQVNYWFKKVTVQIFPHFPPVSALQNLFNNSPVSLDSPAFSYTHRGKTSCITYSVFTKRLKYLLSICGINPELYSGHSFRRGGASFLYKLGADPILIKLSGDWLSDAYLRYVSVDLDHRMFAQQMMVDAISS